MNRLVQKKTDIDTGFISAYLPYYYILTKRDK